MCRPAIQNLFIPGFSQVLRDILVDIDNDPAIGDPLHNVIPISAGGNNTTIHDNHWENGYGIGAIGSDEKTGAYRYRVYTRVILVRVEGDATTP